MISETQQDASQKNPSHKRYILIILAVIFGISIVGFLMAYKYSPSSLVERIKKVDDRFFESVPDYKHAIEPVELILAEERLASRQVESDSASTSNKGTGEGTVPDFSAAQVVGEMRKIGKVNLALGLRSFFIGIIVLVVIASLVAITFWQRHQLMALVGMDPNANLFEGK